MFQTADQEGRAAWLAAVQRFVIACGIVPVYLASLPASIAILGWLRALAVTALGVLVALLCFERLFRDWCKLPFTCSYLPGKEMVWLLLFRYSVGHDLLRRHSADAAQRLRRTRRLPRALHRRWCSSGGDGAASASRSGPKAPCSGKRRSRPTSWRCTCAAVEQDASLTSTPQRAPEMFSAGHGRLSRTSCRKPGKKRSPKTAAIPRFSWPPSGKTCATAAA